MGGVFFLTTGVTGGSDAMNLVDNKVVVTMATQSHPLGPKDGINPDGRVFIKREDWHPRYTQDIVGDSNLIQFNLTHTNTHTHKVAGSSPGELHHGKCVCLKRFYKLVKSQKNQDTALQR